MPPHDYSTTPADLPRPIDDGACAHLQNCSVPSIELGTTDGSWVNLAQLDGLSIVFCYPMTGRPGVPLPPDWDAIPGARGIRITGGGTAPPYPFTPSTVVQLAWCKAQRQMAYCRLHTTSMQLQRQAQ